MKYTKHKPPHDKCEQLLVDDQFIGGAPRFYSCTRPAKAERWFKEPKYKPTRLCGIHANQTATGRSG